MIIKDENKATKKPYVGVPIRATDSQMSYLNHLMSKQKKEVQDLAAPAMPNLSIREASVLIQTCLSQPEVLPDVIDCLRSGLL
jgi:hypothetical protein